MSNATEVEHLKAKMLQKSYYVMFRQILDRSKIKDVVLDHYMWIIGLEKSGKVFASGPVFDETEAQGFGMTVFRAGDFDEATELAKGDPFFSAGGVTFEIRRWQLNEGRIQVSFDLSDQSYQLE